MAVHASRRVRLHWALARRRLPRPLPFLLRAIALGLMRPADLHALNIRWYAREVERYGAPAYVESGLFDWERAAIDATFPARGRVVVAAAGAGREMLALHRRGYEVAGSDPSSALRPRAAAPFERAGLAAMVAPALPDRCPRLPGAPFDAGVIGWSAYMFIPTAAAREGFLAELREQLRSGAPVLLSCWLREERGSRRSRVALGLTNVVRRILRVAPAAPGDELRPYFVHRFTPTELEGELVAAGFTLERFGRDGGGHAVARLSAGD